MVFLETSEDSESFTYFDVQNLSIDHSLIMSEIEEYKDLIFSRNSLEQIYFKGDCNLETIELIKDLLSISEYVDDSKIDKYILFDLTSEDVDKILNATYENPSTWKLPYEKENDNYSLTDIPNYRALNTYIKKIKRSNYSPIEQLMRVYDEVKLMDIEISDEPITLPEIIMKKKTNPYGMNKLFSYILTKLGFKTFIGETVQEDKKYYVTLVEVKDEKYGLEGIYLFDPSMDSLSKDDYKDEDIRKINYNFFGIPLSYMNRLTYDEKLIDILSILSINDTEYSREKLDNSRSKKVLGESKKMLSTFNMSFDELHDKVKNTKTIDINTITRINDMIYPIKKEKYNDYLKNNYIIRKKELFTPDTEEKLEEIFEQEKSNQM